MSNEDFENKILANITKVIGLFILAVILYSLGEMHGALNIIRKVIPDFSCETANLGVEDMANPVRMTFKQLNVRSLQTVKL